MASLTPATCPTCGAALRIPSGATHVDCLRCQATLLLPAVVLAERSRSGLALAAAVLVVGLAAVGLGAAALVASLGPTVGPGQVPVPVLTPAPIGVTSTPAASLQNPEPDYLHDAEAMRRIPERLHEASAWTGQLTLLTFDASTRAVVAIVEVEGGAYDSVLFSWGNVVVKPMPLTEQERREYASRRFAITSAQLGRLPALAEATVQDRATQTTVDRVTVSAFKGSAEVEIATVHPRQALDPLVVELAAL